MKTDYDLVNALVAMYWFLGGDRCMSYSNNCPNPAFRCGFTKNELLVNAIITAATNNGKKVVCEYNGNIVNWKIQPSLPPLLQFKLTPSPPIQIDPLCPLETAPFKLTESFAF